MDRTKPKQANLRRAVSSAYYGLFHYLVAKATQAAIGTAPDLLPFRQATARAFVHGTMKEACRAFEIRKNGPQGS